MNKIFILALILLMAMIISSQSVKAGSNDYVASEQAAFFILSPLNREYSTNALTLDIKFSAFPLKYTFECFIDDKFYADAPYTVNVSGTHIQYPAKASMDLPLLSDGYHTLKVVMYSNAIEGRAGPYTATVHFTIDTTGESIPSINPNLTTPSLSSTVPTSSPTVPEFSWLALLVLLLVSLPFVVVRIVRKLK